MKRFTVLIAFFVFLGLQNLLAQPMRITGKVTSAEDGSPLPGVSVVVKGTTTGTVTDVNGNYELQAPQGATTLVFSFVGMKTQEVAIAGQSNISLALTSDALALGEVVVTALGIKRSEKALGYAASTVKAEEIMKARAGDVMSALAGKVAGVDISGTSSSPGSSNAVIIRGMSSLNGSNQPLYVVDGVPIINSMAFGSVASNALDSHYDFGGGNQMINPNDVASVTILKGAAASALYGNRASNGVILITTKEGSKNQKLKVTINSSYEMSDLLRLPTFQNDYGMGWDTHHTLIENGSWGPKFDGTMRIWGTVYNNTQKMKPFVALPDNMKDFFEYGARFQNSIDLSGGTEKSTYYLSFANLNDDGIVPDDYDSYKKNTVSFKGTQEFGKLSVTTSATLSRQQNNFVPTGQGFTVINDLYQIPRDVSIVGLKDLSDPFNTLDYYFTPYGVINPYYSLSTQINDYSGQKIFGKVQLDYKIMEGLTATYRLGFDASDNETKIAWPRLVTTPGTPNFEEVTDPGLVDKSMVRRRESNMDFLLAYQKTIGDFGVNATAGVNLLDQKMSQVGAKIENLDIPSFYDLANTSSSPVPYEDFSQKRMIGILGSVELSLKSYLFLTLTGRQDKTSTLPKDNNTYFYPGTQLSFVFSDLLPENLNSIISLGKVRLAWGKTGKDADPYMLDPVYSQSVIYNPFNNISFPLRGQNAYEVGNRLANLKLQPEIRTEVEGGLQMAFFNGRVGFDVTLYRSISNKQIYPLGLDPSTGYTTQTTNLGEIENKGVEFMFNVSPLRTNDFRWDIDFNYTKNNEKLVSLPEELGDKVDLGGTTAISYVAKVGEPLGLFEVTVPQKTATGQIVVGTDGLPVPAAEKAIVPKAAFDYSMGVTNTFGYKNISFSFDFDIRQGGLLYSRTKDIASFTGNLIETLYNDRQPFIIPNSVNAVADVDGLMDADGSADEDYIENVYQVNGGALVYYWGDGATQLDRAFLIPRSFIKLKRVVLSYTLPKSLLGKLPLQDVAISVFGNNLLLWTPAENHYIDPESSSFGNDLESRYGEFSVNPPTRSFGVNLRLVF